jgi:zinc transporter ZupT
MNMSLVMSLSAATALATMLGGLFALSLTRGIAIALGFSAGAVLGVALFDLAPEALKLGEKSIGAGGLIAAGAAGFLLYGLFDRLVTRHDQPACGANPAKGFLGAGSFSVHSLLDGLGIGIAFQAGPGVGLVVASAVLAHDFADGLNTVNVVVKNGGSRKAALSWLLTDALAPVAGAALSLVWRVPGGTLALLLAGFTGFFFYIGALDLLPESQRAGTKIWSGLATLLGVGLLYGVSLAAV